MQSQGSAYVRQWHPLLSAFYNVAEVDRTVEIAASYPE
jgi:hypothetical protein